MGSGMDFEGIVDSAPGRLAGPDRIAGRDDDARLPRLRYAGHRVPAEVIGYAVWLYFRFPPSLRHVDGPLAARGVAVSHETVRQWGLKFRQTLANRIRRRLPQAGDKWRFDEVETKIAGKKHWIRRAVD